MTDTEIMQVMADVHNRLYRTHFAGEQMMVVSDCIKILRSTIEQMHKDRAEEPYRSKIENSEE